MADSKLSALSEISLPDLNDLLYLVNDTGPTSTKVSAKRLFGTLNHLCQGRVTLQAGVPVTTTDTLGAGTLYFTPYHGDLMSLYDGTRWQLWRFSEAAIALGTLVAARNYDVFAWDNIGTLSYTIGPAWSSDSARGTGAGTTELTQQEGVHVNAHPLPSGPAALAGRYLATFRTTSPTTTEDSFGQVTSQVGGKRFVWNMSQRVPRHLSVKDMTELWSYPTGIWRKANGMPGVLNCVEYVVGINDVEVICDVRGTVYIKNNLARPAKVGVGVNSVTVPMGLIEDGYNEDPLYGNYMATTALYSGYPGLGYTVLAWLERGADGTSIFTGFYQDGQTGLTASLMG